jgi:hypothetical protein
MAKSAEKVAHSDRVFSQTLGTISIKLSAIEQVPGAYLGYRGFWPEAFEKPEIVKTMFYVKCEYLRHLSSHDAQFFLFCASMGSSYCF